MDWLIEAAVSLLVPDGTGRTPGGMPVREVRRIASQLRARLAEAEATDQPLVCEIPAALRERPPAVRSLRTARPAELWRAGTLQLTGTRLTWTPLPDRRGTRGAVNLSAATSVAEMPVMRNHNSDRETVKLSLRAAGREVEVIVRRAFLPFVQVGLRQTAATGRADS